ncbi:hypothetical protein O181_092417 [Austropuccinia psidii MF-1]|uniref:Tet-like 2OG-Fe(II) oxygenase domain-containing protein n=1 Tax=Austropuccinia psidii MF-1 TaxID=1389203 RepID=A0A9Q3IZ37_9BASI|nr:hypothetical protein [Austropuccinia psidii MF-1]
MPPYIIAKNPTRRKLTQAVVRASSKRRGIVGSCVYHFLPAHNRPNVPVCFKRARITRDPQQGAYCIRACLRYSTWLDWKSELEVNQWDELSQDLISKKRFTNPIATNGALLEGFMFAIGWRKCSKKNDQFGQSLRYVGDNLFEKIQNCYNSLGVASFDQVNYEGNIPTNQGACEFASALTFTMNGFKNAPHVDKDASLYALGWWFKADKRTGQIQRDSSKRCTGGKLIFPNENFWIDLSACHGLIQVVWASSTFAHYTDPEQDNESTNWWVCLGNAQGGWQKQWAKKATAIMRMVRERDIK